MPQHSRRNPRSRRNPPPNPGRNPRRGGGVSNLDQQERLSGTRTEREERVRFSGHQGMTSMFEEGKASERASLGQTRAEAAVKAAYLTYEEGVAQHGAGASWETTGSNRGPVVDEIQDANSSTGQEWCGMFIGDSYQKAGIREEIMSGLVFWSGYRLHLFFTQGRSLSGAFGQWWQTHQTTQLGSGTGQQRKAALDAFNPQPGDIALFRSDYSHVGMVTSYDSATGTLEIIEGNRGNRVQATAYDTGDGQITFLGRFNDSDYEPGGSVDAEVASAEMPQVSHGSSSGSTR